MKVTIVKIDGSTIEFIQDGGKDIESAELEKWVKSDYVKLGDAEVTIKNGKVEHCRMDSSGETEHKSDGKKSGKWEDDMVTFETLLTKAHALKKPFSIKTEMIQLDVEKKFALFKAQVIVETIETNEMVFEGHGDATSENVTGEFIKPHFIRLAETRSIVRALRWYTNNGVAEEEKK